MARERDRVKMELRAIMEFGDGRDSQLGEEDTPYIVEEQIQPLCTNSACVSRYYRKGTRYYRRAPRYYRLCSRDPNNPDAKEAEGGRTAGAVIPLPLAVLPQGRDGSDIGKA